MKLTQTQRVIAAAKSYRGVTQVDFLGTHTIDGGPPITRVAARIQDARDEGHEFENLGTRQSCKVYRWVSGPDEVERERAGTTATVEDVRRTLPGPPAEPQPSPTLFDLSTAEPHWKFEAA